MVVASREARTEHLIRAYAQISAANQRTLEQLAVVLGRFRSHGIDCLLLKGADLLSRLYGLRGLRPLSDVDLWVQERDLPAIDRLLTELGYRPTIDGNPAYTTPDGSLILDLVTDVWYAEDSDAIWRRAIRRTVAGVPVMVMGSDDLLIYLTAYTVLHRGWFPPFFAKDIALLLRKEPLDWAFVFEEAVRTHLKIPLYHGLSYVAQREPHSISPDALALFAPTTANERLWLTLLRTLVTEVPLPNLGHLLLLSLPGRKKRLRRLIWPSTDFLRYRYGAHGVAAPTRTRLLRIADLAVKAASLLGQVLCRLVRRGA